MGQNHPAKVNRSIFRTTDETRGARDTGVRAAGHIRIRNMLMESRLKC
jgi:hypothetical protein